jgi:hypothetical protein
MRIKVLHPAAELLPEGSSLGVSLKSIAGYQTGCGNCLSIVVVSVCL